MTYPAARSEPPGDPAVMRPQVPQRARGQLLVDARLRAGRTRLENLRQEGCLRACFPRTDGAALSTVLLNMSGGITDGEVLRMSLQAGAGADMVASTAAAERIYRARPGAAPAQLDIDVTVGAGARLAYLPQETILFDGSAMNRVLRIDVSAGGTYLGVESLVFGRAASGETLREVFLRDTVRLHREGRLVLHDQVLLQGPAARWRTGKATAGGGRVVATIIYMSDDAQARLDDVRDAVLRTGTAGGASFRDGVLVARVVAPDTQSARHAVIGALTVLRGGRPLPRVWSC